MSAAAAVYAMSSKASVDGSPPGFARLSILLLPFLILAPVAGAAAANAPSPATQPAGPSDNHTPEKTIIIERHLLPQWEIDEAYRQGQQQGYAQGQLDATYNARTEKLLRGRDDALHAGLQAFAEGRYDQAADYFILGTELDHADAASRIHAAQALFALEQYEDAVPLVRRALELQPRLLQLKFDLRGDYGDPRDFQQQVQSFTRYLAANPKWQDGYVLLGYELLYSGQRQQAHQVLATAVSLNAADKLAAALYKASVPLPRRTTPPAQPTVRPSLGKQNRT